MTYGSELEGGGQGTQSNVIVVGCCRRGKMTREHFTVFYRSNYYFHVLMKCQRMIISHVSVLKMYLNILKMYFLISCLIEVTIEGKSIFLRQKT